MKGYQITMEPGMARPRSLKVSALNITLNPHPPGVYFRLLKDVADLGRAVQIRGTKAGVISFLRQPTIDRDGTKLVRGEFVTFDHIEIDGPWLNLKSHKPATEAELASVSIPEHLQPNAKFFPFVFYEQNHTLYFLSHEADRNVAPEMANKLFRFLFAQPSIRKEFGEPNVTTVPEREVLEEIIALPRLRSITIDLSIPNPDGFERTSSRVYGRMDRLGAARITQRIVATHDETIDIQADPTIYDQLVVAAENGSVVASGTNDAGKRVKLSTSDRPMLAEVKYDPDTQLPEEAFEQKAAELHAGRHRPRG